MNAPNNAPASLCADDLAELIYRIFDDWTADSELFHVPNVFDFTYGDLGTLIAGYFPGTKVVYGEDRPQAYPRRRPRIAIAVRLFRHDTSLRE